MQTARRRRPAPRRPLPLTAPRRRTFAPSPLSSARWCAPADWRPWRRRRSSQGRGWPPSWRRRSGCTGGLAAAQGQAARHSQRGRPFARPAGAAQPLVMTPPSATRNHRQPLLAHPTTAPLPPCRNLPTAGMPQAAASPYGVVLAPSIPYASAPRQQLDVYMPQNVYNALPGHARGGEGATSAAAGAGQEPRDGSSSRQQGVGEPSRAGAAQQPPPPPARVVLWVHGGVWASGERSHFAPLATRLAQSGLVVVVVSYTLWPHAMAWAMAGEVAAALHWTLSHVSKYGGDPTQVMPTAWCSLGPCSQLGLVSLTPPPPPRGSLTLSPLRTHPTHTALPPHRLPEQVTCMGHSAGAHLLSTALLVRAQQREEQLQRRARHAGFAASAVGWGDLDWLACPAPAACIGMSGVYNIQVRG